jgi:uncharacterized protein YegP (UPF0339 family)
MSTNPAWRGQRRVRVALEFGARTVRVAGLWPLDGPAVQRPALDGTYVAQIAVDGVTALLQSFDDPLLVRGSSRPEIPGHSYQRSESALVHVDVPISAEVVPANIAITIVDLSKVARRPVEPELVQKLLDAPPKSVRRVAVITTVDLAAHPDWASLGLPGGTSTAGSFEIYVDKAGKYRWRLRRPDGQIVADSGQGYARRADCENDLRWIRQNAGTVPIRSTDLQ